VNIKPGWKADNYVTDEFQSRVRTQENIISLGIKTGKSAAALADKPRGLDPEPLPKHAGFTGTSRGEDTIFQRIR
jgi:hypothetical protein